MRKASILSLLLAFLPLVAGAQDRRISIKEAEALIPREIRKPVKSMIPGEKPAVHDTLDTSNPIIKIVLLNDGTWHYAKDMRFLADSSIFPLPSRLQLAFLLPQAGQGVLSFRMEAPPQPYGRGPSSPYEDSCLCGFRRQGPLFDV